MTRPRNPSKDRIVDHPRNSIPAESTRCSSLIRLILAIRTSCHDNLVRCDLLHAELPRIGEASRRHAQDSAVGTIGGEIERTVRTLAYVANAFVQALQQTLL